MTWGIERGRGRGPARRAARLAPLVLSLLPSLLPAAPASPAEVRSTLDKIDRTIAQAERAVGKKDPGKVSYILIHADELLASFVDQSGLEPLTRAIDNGHAAARASDMPAAAAAARRASGLMSPVTDFVVLRQAAVSSREAVAAAEARNAEEYSEALDRFDAAILAPVLLARVRETRDAVSRARQAMVRNNMPDGKARIAEARRAFNGLVHAGALSRACYSLSIGAEILQGGSILTARDQIEKAMRDLKLASETGPDDSRAFLDEARAQTNEIWKRSGRAEPGDAGHLADLAREVDAVRLKQPR
jgi:hypothetical protein